MLLFSFCEFKCVYCGPNTCKCTGISFYKVGGLRLWQNEQENGNKSHWTSRSPSNQAKNRDRVWYSDVLILLKLCY